eukprot:9319273-Pyramimonas_sp.AAC.1
MRIFPLFSRGWAQLHGGHPSHWLPFEHIPEYILSPLPRLGAAPVGCTTCSSWRRCTCSFTARAPCLPLRSTPRTLVSSESVFCATLASLFTCATSPHRPRHPHDIAS